MSKFDEYQGFDKLYYAPITLDTNGEDGEYTVGKFKQLAPAGEISIANSSETATKYYDNVPFLNISSEAATEISLTTPILPIETLAEITGKDYDETTGSLLDSGNPTIKYFALAYRLMFTDGSYRYVVRHKGSFVVGEESSKSKDDSTDTTNQTFTYTSINTTHEFTKTSKSSKAIVVDERDGKCDVSTWFTDVVTPDNIKAKTTPSV